MKINVVVDQVEEGIAVLELDEEHFIHFPAVYLPPGLREGETLSLTVERKEESRPFQSRE